MSDHRVAGAANASSGHYVYLYRDLRDNVRYIGYGRTTARPTSHLAGSHSERLNAFLTALAYRIEIAGPFESEQVGRAVETALISALKPDLNIALGQSTWRFRPLGVPVSFAPRQVEPELALLDFLKLQGPARAPVLFVIVTDANFVDDRVGYDPANPPTDEQIRSRVDRWWQLQRLIPGWVEHPAASPGLLVGVFGSPGRQTVIASASIDRRGWGAAEHSSGGKSCIPLVEPASLDAFGLRGRRIARDAGLMFGGIPSQFYILLGLDGIARGGHHQRKG